MKVPTDVQAIIGKRVFSRNLQTSHLRQARLEGARIRAEWHQEIAHAREGNSPRVIRAAAAKWKSEQDRDRRKPISRNAVLGAHGLDGSVLPSDTEAGDERDAFATLSKVLYEAVRGGDAPESLGRALDAAGLPDTAESRRAVGRALLEIEHAKRLRGEANAAAIKSHAFEQNTFGVSTPLLADKLTGMRLSGLYADFKLHHPANAKETAKRDQYLKRLTEFLGEDADVGTVTVRQAGDFWLALQKLPARRSTKELAKLDFNALIKTGLPPIGEKALFQWQLFYKRLFAHAVDYELITANPFRNIKLKLDKSELEGEAYSPGEIEVLFKTPLFTGHGGDYDRCVVGGQITKDWRYWIPILSLWTGTRLNEWSAADTSEIVQHGDGWFLDLSKRPVGGDLPNRVKTKAARRLVPLHQRLIDLGFLTYVEGQNGPLFPDLHGHKMHPAARAANWFTRHRGKSKIEKTVHELRHTWKRMARSRGMSPEISDLITAHVSGGMGRKYGAGVEPATLTEAIKVLDFPTFPLTV